MRKSAFIARCLALFLIFSQQIQINFGQDFGRKPLRECWQLTSDYLSELGFASDNAFGFIIPLNNGTIEAVDKNSGKALWISEIGGQILSPIVADENLVYAISTDLSLSESEAGLSGNQSASLHALSISTGVSIWQKTLLSERNTVFYLLQDNALLYLISQAGRLIIVNKQKGEILSDANLNLRIDTVPFLAEDKFYLSASGKIVSVNKRSGDKENELKIEHPPTSFLFAEDSLYVGDKIGNVISVSLKTKGWKKRWKSWTGAEITSLTDVPGGLLISSFDNFVYLLSRKNGKRLWKKRLSGRSAGRPLIRDGVAVFSVQGGSEAIFIDLETGKSINQLNAAEDEYFVNNPVFSGKLIVLQTQKRILAFGTEADCKAVTAERITDK